MRVLEAAMAQRWAMLEPWVRTVLEIASGENEPVDAVEARLGRKLDNAQNVVMRDGVAIIPVMGPIFPRANLFTEVSGATSVQTLARDFTAAVENPMVRGIILNVDSPGGSINGIHEFAEMVHEARGKKPMAAYVGSLMASAAYHIGSATGEIVMDRMAGVGSLGVVAVLPDPTKKQSKELEIVSSQSPKKRIDVSTEAGRSHIQAEVDKLADIMLEKIAQYRGMTQEDVMRAEGAMVLAEDALQIGLADRMGSLEGLIAEMAKPGYMPHRAAKEKKRMSGFVTRIKAALGLSAEAEPEAIEANAEEVAAAVEAQKNELEASKQEIERLTAELHARNEERAAEAKRIEEETEKRIAAEVEATIVKYDARLGRTSREALKSALREAKVAGGNAESCLLAFVESLPVIGSGERSSPATVDMEAVAVEIATPLPVDTARDARIKARAEKDGVSYNEAWAIVVREEQEAAIAKA